MKKIPIPETTVNDSNELASPVQLPSPLNLEGRSFFLLFFLHNSLMNILQEIFTDHYEEIIYTLHPRKSGNLRKTFFVSQEHLVVISYDTKKLPGKVSQPPRSPLY